MLRIVLLTSLFLAGLPVPAGAALLTGTATEPSQKMACQRARSKAEVQASGYCRHRGGVQRVTGGTCESKDYSKVYRKRMYKASVTYGVQCLRRG